MSDPWTLLLGAASVAYDKRAEIQGAWDTIRKKLLKRNENILVTGMPGAGKTVLMHHITGEAYRRNYQDPGESIGLEKADLKDEDRNYYSLLVIPGQDSPQRVAATEKALKLSGKLSGVIHVVSNGYNTVRGFEAERALVDRGLVTIEQFLQNQREKEVQAFADTLELLRNAMRNSHFRPWLLLAIDKVDLYADQDSVNAVKALYGSPSGGFQQALELFSRNVGSDNFAFRMWPVCGALEDFTWNADTTKSTLPQNKRDELIGAMLHKIEQFVGWQK